MNDDKSYKPRICSMRYVLLHDLIEAHLEYVYQLMKFFEEVLDEQQKDTR